MFESSFAHLTSTMPLEWTGRHQGSSCALVSLPATLGRRSWDRKNQANAM